jgi:hypothetical protein
MAEQRAVAERSERRGERERRASKRQFDGR